MTVKFWGSMSSVSNSSSCIIILQMIQSMWQKYIMLTSKLFIYFLSLKWLWFFSDVFKKAKDATKICSQSTWVNLLWGICQSLGLLIWWQAKDLRQDLPYKRLWCFHLGIFQEGVKQRFPLGFNRAAKGKTIQK